MTQLIRLKISYDKKTFRTLDIPATASLERLAKAIVGAYGFMFDHAFGFYNNLEDHYESTEVYTLFADMDKSLLFDDEGLEGKSVRQTTVGDVFKRDKEMLFLFDYGDEWFFHIRCLDEDAPREKGKRYPKVVESKGEAPEQYPDYEEEDEE